ncbi:MAG: DUF3102 domain-containing protein [Chloroflexi bacterium]|nr:DUF3102 domain-containing protein [Chloroflexota bacterium]
MTNDLRVSSQPFDYNALDVETRIVVQQRTSEIKTIAKRAAQDIIDIGTKLIEVKSRLEHGQFGQWLEAEFGWTQRTATNFMHVAAKFENFSNLGEIAPSALYLLAAPSTPDDVREQMIERAAAGEVITHKITQQAVAELKAKFDQDAITLVGRTDDGAWHRAIEISRRLVVAGIWNGSDPIEFNAYLLHDRLYGPRAVSPDELERGIDYRIRIRPVELAGGESGQGASDEVPAATKLDPEIVADFLAEGPKKLVDFWNKFHAPNEEVFRVLAVLEQQGRLDKPAPGTYALKPVVTLAKPVGTAQPRGLGPLTAAPARPTGDDDYEPQGLPLSLGVVREFIGDALRKSNRPLGYDELKKYAGREAGRDIPSSLYDRAMSAMLAAGSVTERMHERAGRRFHFADFQEDAPVPVPVQEQAPAESEVERLILSCNMLLDHISVLRRLAEFDGWSSVNTARRRQISDLLIQVGLQSQELSRLADTIDRKLAAAG